ncbi:OmpH family outer membrane protein [Candidatus Dependentiae bacterium]|nr:OmpH family outer membrane protein [Candidatus Dependentiae bacterium]
MSKKLLASFVFLAVSGCCVAGDASNNVFSIDSNKLLRESREGRALLGTSEKDKENVMKIEYEQSKKIGELRSKIEDGVRAGKFTEDVLQEKYEELGRLQKKAKRLVEDAREDFDLKKQREIVKFRNKVHMTAADYFNKAGGSIVFDKATPGIIYVADSTDRTDSLLKELNSRYEKEKATSMLTKDKTKKA